MDAEKNIMQRNDEEHKLFIRLKSAAYCVSSKPGNSRELTGDEKGSPGTVKPDPRSVP